MSTIGDIANGLEIFAPTSLAEEWDNVGLLVGDPSWPAQRIMTCLTVTPTTVAEAIERKANLIVSHHPLPFQAIKSVTSSSTVGKMLLDLIGAKVGIYSPHTAFDSAPAGINQHLAIGLGLQQIEPLIPISGCDDKELGSGRIGNLTGELTLQEMAQKVKEFLGIKSVQVVGENDQMVSRISIACGSGGSFLSKAIAAQSNCLVTGETNLHTCLEAEAKGVGVILPGHFASERFALHSLSDYLSEQFSDIETWASTTEKDPLRTL